MKTLDLSAQDLDAEQLKTQLQLLRKAADLEGLAPLERLIISPKTMEALKLGGEEASFMGFSIGVR
jgi:hypothetical protein